MAYLWARDASEMKDTIAMLERERIPYFAWREPDRAAVDKFFGGHDLTALAVTPVDQRQRKHFRHLEKVFYGEGGRVSPQDQQFQLPRHSPVVSNNKTADSKSADAGEGPAGRASFVNCS